MATDQGSGTEMQRQRELSTFPIAPVHKAKLTACGFLIVDDLIGIKPLELSKEVGITPEESLEIIKTVLGDDEDTTKKKSVTQKAISALDMLQDEQSCPSIITFSEQIDLMLGDGVPLCKITEFCGAPGIGKTQMCEQLSVDVQIPECFGGVGGSAVYIDTEGSFIVERVEDIAKATVEHCEQIAQSDGDDEQRSLLKSFTVESIVSNIHYFRCHDYIELLATVHLLPKFIKQHKNVKLIVVDSIAFHFRHDFEDFSLRTRLLTAMAQSFIKLATEYKLAVVLTNQMTTKVHSGSGGNLIPALGESWGHASTIRVILFWEGNNRYALLYKSPTKKETVVPYQITVGGIRDVVSQEENPSDEFVEDMPQKRQRLT